MINITYGKTLKIQTGASFSDIRYNIFNKITYNDNRLKQPIFIGVDYFDHQYYNVSTNIGYVIKAEEENVSQEWKDMGYPYCKNELEYISFNTTIDFKYPIYKKIIPFVSIGPRFDFLTHNTQKFQLYKPEYLNDIIYGVIIGCGIKYDFEKIQIGARIDYYHNFNEIAKWPGGDIMSEGGNIKDKTYTFNFVIGYKF